MNTQVVLTLAWVSFTVILGSPLPNREATGDQDRDRKIAWLKANRVKIRSADIADIDFSDLRPLTDRIGKSRIVMLGEQTHCDGTTFLMKGRLIRFLHEKLGFDVIAWENGLYTSRELDAALRSSLSIEEATAKYLRPHWACSEQVRPLFEYVRSTYSTKHPLEIAGFDCEINTKESRESFPGRLFAFLAPINGSFQRPQGMEELLVKGIDAGDYNALSAEDKLKYKKFIRQLPALINNNKAKLEKAHGARDLSFWKHLADSLQRLIAYNELNFPAENDRQYSKAEESVRDIAMGETLVWLAGNYYRNRKVVVWAGTMHLVHDAGGIDTSGLMFDGKAYDYRGLVCMGDIVHRRLGNSVYSVMFTAFKGMVGNTVYGKSWPLAEPPADSLEDCIHQLGNEYVFVDLRSLHLDPSHWLHRGISARPLGNSNMRADWAKNADAVIYTETMIPSTGRCKGAEKDGK